MTQLESHVPKRRLWKITKEDYVHSIITSISGGSTWIRIKNKAISIAGYPDEIESQFKLKDFVIGIEVED